MGSLQSCFADEDSFGRESTALLKPTVEEEKEERENFLWIFEGVIGTGKSSSINTVFQNFTLCKVSAAQIQGTKNFDVRQSTLRSQGHEYKVTFADVEGFPFDQKLNVQSIQYHLNLRAQSQVDLSCAQILFSFDSQQRATKQILYNTLVLIEIYRGLRLNCFICFTKWNTNSVMADWNKRLADWVRKNKRKDYADLSQPPTPEDFFQDYCSYLRTTLLAKNDSEALQKIATILQFFGDRVLWLYNLDDVEIEDKVEGELPDYKDFLFTHYRNLAVNKLLNYHLTSLQNKSISYKDILTSPGANELGLSLLTRVDELVANKQDPSRIETIFHDLLNHHISDA